ncbi:dipicolinate synthase subunit DpsA [Clostridium sp. C105KSO13]|uniref:dipicolinate synthase subunit DpsA n=1 Tax=Clostridium sp. C105KSO13 TaxID=1776045 RepID=UPI0007405A37|nr:dipicolinate synthase subunit DpsA [Clostridium sp. C105KSO13]CUX40460.1 Dipicolinate synthase subunit A [Clostridium sp. C105KSO13]
MEYPQYDFTVIGGDMRQVYLVEELSSSQTQVCHYALVEKPDKCRCGADSHLSAAVSLKNACSSSRCVICPIPLSKDGTYLNQGASIEDVSLASLLSALQPGQYFFAGCIPENFRSFAVEKGVSVFDFMQNDTLAVYNTIATAEGAICEAIIRSPLNLNQSRCAVLGYGKCGSTLVSYLKAMFCRVYTFCNNPGKRARAAVVSDGAGDLEDFKKSAEDFDFIFNTIPALVVLSDTLKVMKPSVTIIDISSAPGGVDYKSAKTLGKSAALCPGLPGKYSPASSAKALRESIESILSQEKQL